MISILLRITSAAFLSLVLDYSESRPVSFLRVSCDITDCTFRSLFVVPLTDVITLLARESIRWACGMCHKKIKTSLGISLGMLRCNLNSI